MLTLLTNHFSTPLGSGSQTDVKGNPSLGAFKKKTGQNPGMQSQESDPVGLGLSQGIGSVSGTSGDLDMLPAVGVDSAGRAKFLKQFSILAAH